MKTVLVVDDTLDIIKLLEFMLTKMGYFVTSARNAQQALAKIKLQPTDLVFLDVHLQDQDGVAVCQSIKADPELKHIPVILMSASNDDSFRRKQAIAQADGLLFKPFLKKDVEKLTSQFFS